MLCERCKLRIFYVEDHHEEEIVATYHIYQLPSVTGLRFKAICVLAINFREKDFVSINVYEWLHSKKIIS